MPRTIAAEFTTRRDAEMTVEHLVQEHGLDPSTIVIAPVEDRNSAGTELDGSDRENTGDKAGAPSHPVLAGKLRVSVEADEAVAEKILGSFATYGGKQLP